MICIPLPASPWKSALWRRPVAKAVDHLWWRFPTSLSSGCSSIRIGRRCHWCQWSTAAIGRNPSWCFQDLQKPSGNNVIYLTFVESCSDLYWLRLGLVDFVGSEARTEKYVAVGHIAYSWCEFQCHALQSAVENEICRLIYRNCSPSSEYFMCPSMNIWSFEAHYTHALRLDPGTNRTWWKQCAKKKRTRRLCCRHLQDGPRSETLEGHLFQPNSHHCQRKAAAPSNASLFQRTDAALPSFTVPCYVAHVRRKMLQRFDWLWCKIHWMTFHCSFVPFQIVLACHFGTESSQFSGVQWNQATVHDLDPIYLCIALQEDIKTSFSVVFSFFLNSRIAHTMLSQEIGRAIASHQTQPQHAATKQYLGI